MREPMMSGLCAFPQTGHPEASHERCPGGNRARPSREFAPCPCPCHYPAEHFECESCGGTLVEAPLWPDEWAEYEKRDPEPVYTHIDPSTGRATGFECNGAKAISESSDTGESVSGNEPEPVVYEPADDGFDDLLAELDEEF